MLVLHGYLWWRLVCAPRAPAGAPGLTALTVVLALLPALAIGAARHDAPARRGPAGLGGLHLAGHRLLPLPHARWSWSRCACSPACARGAAVARHCGCARSGPAGPATMSRPRRSRRRRVFLAAGLAVTAGAVALGTAGTGVVIANSAPVVRRVPITLSAAGPGARRAADRHLLRRPPVGHLRRTALRAARRDVNAPAPGPRGHRRRPGRRQRRRPRRGRRAAGATCVSGTASSSSPATTSTSPAPAPGSRTCARSACDVLQNERVAIAPRRRRSTSPASTTIAASPASRARAPTSPRALGGRDARRAGRPAGPPAGARRAGRGRRGVDLQLSGHTHGGQLWPFDYVAASTSPRSRAVAARRHPALRHRGRRLLGSADAGRRHTGGHRGRAAARRG